MGKVINMGGKARPTQPSKSDSLEGLAIEPAIKCGKCESTQFWVIPLPESNGHALCCTQCKTPVRNFMVVSDLGSPL